MKIICVGRNYVKHIEELKNEVPDQPAIFMKHENALLTGNTFFLPSFSSEIHHEIELVFRFSKKIPAATQVSIEDCFDALTVGIDFTARDIQDKLKEKRLSWELSKAFDQSALVGRFLPVSSFPDFQKIDFHLDINKNTVQKGSSSHMIFSVKDIVSFVSRFMTIEKGDLLFTGTPQGVGRVNNGDLLEGYLMNEKLFEVAVNE